MNGYTYYNMRFDLTCERVSRESLATFEVPEKYHVKFQNNGRIVDKTRV